MEADKVFPNSQVKLLSVRVHIRPLRFTLPGRSDQTGSESLMGGSVGHVKKTCLLGRLNHWIVSSDNVKPNFSLALITSGFMASVFVETSHTNSL